MGMSTAPLTGGGMDIDAFQRQSDERAQKNMIRQEQLATRAEDQSLFDSLLKQRIESAKTTAKLAETAPTLSNEASKEFNR